MTGFTTEFWTNLPESDSNPNPNPANLTNEPVTELLQKHVDVVHDLIMEFMCDHCEYVTAYTGDLEAHVKRVHSGGGEEDSKGDTEAMVIVPDAPPLKLESISTGMNCIKIGLPGKLILGEYFQENMTYRRPFLLLRISFPERPIFIQLPPDDLELAEDHGETENTVKNGGQRFRCEHCGYETDNKKVWSRHTQTMHGQGQIV